MQEHVFCNYPSFPVSTRLKQLALLFSAGTFPSACPASGCCREEWQRRCERCLYGHGAPQLSFRSFSSSGELPISQQEAPRCREQTPTSILSQRFFFARGSLA